MLTRDGVRDRVRDWRPGETTCTHVSARTHTCRYVPIHTRPRIPLPTNINPNPNPIPLPCPKKAKNQKNKKRWLEMGLGLGISDQAKPRARTYPHVHAHACTCPYIHVHASPDWFSLCLIPSFIRALSNDKWQNDRKMRIPANMAGIFQIFK